MPIQKEKACKGTALKNIKYITDPQKTIDEDGRRWVATHNMLATGRESGAELHKEFREVNNLWKKNKDFDERKYYHLVINFKGIEGVTPEMAMTVGRAYLEHFYPNNQAVMAVHCDNDGYHFHACINSVNMETGKKIDRTDKDLADRKDYVNEVAEKLYGIEPFDWRAAVDEKRAEEEAEKPIGKNNNYNYAEQQMHATGRTSELDELRSKILRIALTTYDREEFERKLLEEYGISMPRNTKKTVSFKYKEGEKGTIRGRTLGDYYTAKYIDKILAYNRRHEQEHTTMDRQAPNFNDLNEIARNKNYIVAKNAGFDMPVDEFKKASENELTCRFAFIFIKRRKGIEYKNGTFFFNGQEVKTDERIQAMYDATVAARRCMDEYGINDRRDLEKRYTEFDERLESLKTELRKERKIETSLKNKVKRNENLHNALKIVYQNTGTPEEINQAKRLLYRNGIKQEQFKDVATISEISKRVIESRRALTEQSRKTRELYFAQRDLQKAIDSLDTALTGVTLANNPRFYLGDDIDKRLAIEPEQEEKRTPAEQQTPEEDTRTFEQLLADAMARGGEPGNGKGQEKGRTRTQAPEHNLE